MDPIVILLISLLVVAAIVIWFSMKKDSDNQDCKGTHDPEPVCPTDCGYQKQTFTRKFNVTKEHKGSGKACPEPIIHTCSATPACSVVDRDCQGRFEQITCPTECGYPGGNITKRFIISPGGDPTGNGQACPEDQVITCQATQYCVRADPVFESTDSVLESQPAVVDRDCEGSYEEPDCPTHCGYAGGTVTQQFIINQEGESQGNGQACPEPREYQCPATSACDYYALKNCVWGSTEAYTQECPDANQLPGGGTCYKNRLDASMYKTVTPTASDAQVATRCYNEITVRGMSVGSTLGQNNYAQAQQTCESQGTGWRLPRTIDEAGKACGTGFGYDDAFVWMDSSFRL